MLPDEQLSQLSKPLQSPDGVIREALLQLCTEETAIEIARHIVERMRREADRETLDFDFHIDAATGRMGVGEAFNDKNTWFRFDTRAPTLLDELKQVEYEQNNNASENGLILAFHDHICKMLLDHFADEVAAVLKDKMFGGKDAPIRLVRVTHFDMTDFSHVNPDECFQLVVEKAVPKYLMDVIAPVGVSAELFRINMETGKGFNEIIREKKAAGDPNYDYVKSAYTQKMLYECEIDFYVDYSGDPIAYEGQAAV